MQVKNTTLAKACCYMQARKYNKTGRAVATQTLQLLQNHLAVMLVVQILSHVTVYR